MRRFKARKIKRKEKKHIKLIVFLFFFFFAYIFVFRYCYYSNKKLKNNVLNKDITYINFNPIKLVNEKVNDGIKNPISLLNNKVKNVSFIDTKKTTLVVNQSVNNVIKEDIYDPVVYVYNTHQEEKYSDYSVYDASYLLSSNLNNNGIDSYFEEQSVTAFLQDNNLKYYKSYTASRKYIQEAKEKYNNLTYYFDIHRDSVNKEKSTFLYDNENYAKVMFIVGLDNLNYQENLNNTTKLNNIINSKIPGISRGIMKKQGKGVNGIYNQDYSPNLFLIEVGGPYNTKDEVQRTINIIYESILEYIKGAI